MSSEDVQLCDELRSIGVDADSIYDLVNSSEPYDAAIPVLLRWLPRAKDRAVKEGIVRALTLKNAGPEVSRALIQEFEKHRCCADEEAGLMWAIGNAIAETSSTSDLPDLIRLSLDAGYGRARQMVVMAIGKRGRKDKDDALQALLTLLQDPDVQGHAVAGLRFLGDQRSRKPLEPFVRHEMAWIRNDAKKALDKLDKKKGGKS